MTTTSPKTPRPNTVRLRVSDQELEWLHQHAEDEQRSIANILRVALREYLDRRVADDSP